MESAVILAAIVGALASGVALYQFVWPRVRWYVQFWRGPRKPRKTGLPPDTVLYIQAELPRTLRSVDEMKQKLVNTLAFGGPPDVADTLSKAGQLTQREEYDEVVRVLKSCARSNLRATDRAVVNILIGEACSVLERWDEAATHYFRAWLIAERAQDKRCLAVATCKLAVSYEFQNDGREAIERFKEAQALLQKIESA